jgi:hypothetical protein
MDGTNLLSLIARQLLSQLQLLLLLLLLLFQTLLTC